MCIQKIMTIFILTLMISTTAGEVSVPHATRVVQLASRGGDVLRTDDTQASNLVSQNAIQPTASSSKANQEIDLLYRTVQAEAGNQPHDGKVAVANVIMNRVESERFPDTIREVVYAPNQFEVVRNGAINRVIPSDDTRDAVDEALSGKHIVPASVTYFATPKCDFSTWATRYTRIGGHVFWSTR